jgi:hypothetical protein
MVKATHAVVWQGGKALIGPAKFLRCGVYKGHNRFANAKFGWQN